MNMNIKSATITRLALLSVSSRDAALLWMMVNREFADEFVIGVAASAHIAISDGAAADHRQAVENWQAEHPGKPIVVLGVADREPLPNVTHLPRPLRMNEVATALAKARRASPPSGTMRRSGDMPGSLRRHPADSASEILKVDICMAVDPREVLDSIGISRNSATAGRLDHAAGARSLLCHSGEPALRRAAGR